MTEAEIIKRKIILKRQLVEVVKKEIKELEARLKNTRDKK